MTEIEQKALALVNAIQDESGETHYFNISANAVREALCRAIEQHEAFRQEVSDAVVCYFSGLDLNTSLHRFIIPAPKPDPLVEIIGELDDGTWGETKAEYAERLRADLVNRIRATLADFGFEIREKNDGQ